MAGTLIKDTGVPVGLSTSGPDGNLLLSQLLAPTFFSILLFLKRFIYLSERGREKVGPVGD